MISISAAVSIVLYLIVGALVFGLLWFALTRVGAIVGEGGQPFIKVGQVLLIVLAVFVCIGIVLSLVGGVQVFKP